MLPLVSIIGNAPATVAKSVGTSGFVLAASVNGDPFTRAWNFADTVGEISQPR